MRKKHPIGRAHRLPKIFKEPSIISYKRGKSASKYFIKNVQKMDILVKAKLSRSTDTKTASQNQSRGVLLFLYRPIISQLRSFQERYLQTACNYFETTYFVQRLTVSRSGHSNVKFNVQRLSVPPVPQCRKCPPGVNITRGKQEWWNALKAYRFLHRIKTLNIEYSLNIGVW